MLQRENDVWLMNVDDEHAAVRNSLHMLLTLLAPRDSAMQ